MTNRYMTSLSYTDGNGKKRTTKVYFELDPIELMDWTMENAFEANELRASLIELQAIEKEDSRDLTPDEVATMLGVIKLLAQLSAGRPTDDGEYFLKDPNWTSSYAYRAFRTLLLTNSKETQQFLTTVLDNDVMVKFTEALDRANAENAAAADSERTSDSGPDVVEKMKAQIAEQQAEIARIQSQQTSDGAHNVTSLPTPQSE